MAKYDPSVREKHWQQFWADKGVYHFHPKSDKPIYSIDTPPPTVSGKLHLGHVFSYTQTEVLARYFRLSGHNLYYPFGMDDNGLPTERLVEAELGIKGSDLPRNEFIQKCLDTVDIYHQKYRDLWQSLGFSVDWRLEYSTISPEIRALTQKNFKLLYQQGIAYRQESPALWCSTCQTAIAQAEVEDKQVDSIFYDLVFTLENGHEILIATTRPELLSACVAVFINPKDKRYKKLIGTYIITPLGDKVKIFADDKVQIDKGTGIVMCCTYGDETDLFWKKQFNLDEKIIINKDGKFNQLAFPQIQNLTIPQGRKTIVEYLKSKNLIKKELPIIHDVGCHERCKTPIEIINTFQWFVKVLNIKDEILKLADQINWYPKTMKIRFVAWVENLKWDWAISRDRFYGISVPVYYCSSCGEVILPQDSELPLDPQSQTTKNTCPKCQNSRLIGEHLVFDTWFTSGNSPEINTSLNQNLTGQQIKIPMSLRAQAHDIIRTWAFYTIVLSYYKNKKIPWKDIAISGHLLLRKGEKISKRTGGGVIRPEDEIATHSADAIRYAMCSASLGLDSYYDAHEIQNGKKLVNKLFNASNFVISALKDYHPQPLDLSSLRPIDLWLYQQSLDTAQNMAKYFDKYDYTHPRDLAINFFWETFCDYYLEIIKKRIYELKASDPQKLSAQTTLYHTLQTILTIFSPFVPHITEEIYQSYFALQKNMPSSVHQTNWPKISQNSRLSPDHQKTIEELLKIISLVRAEKSKNGINLAQPISNLTINHPWLTSTHLSDFIFDLQAVTRASEIEINQSARLSVVLKY